MKATHETATELKTELTRTMNLLRTLRDEIRVEVHLATMDTKRAWEALEPRFGEAERHMQRANEASKNVIEQVAEAFDAFMRSLRARDGGATPRTP